MPSVRPPDGPAGLPYLEHYPEPGGVPQRIVLHHFPFRLGRDQDADHIVYSRRVSKNHAVIVHEGGDFLVLDLGSTNGTFVNGQRVAESHALYDGDILHVAHKEFRFGHEPAEEEPPADNPITESAENHLPYSLIQGREHLRSLIEHRQFRIAYQPIVRLGSGEVMGYEALARGSHEKLNDSPLALFAVAEQCLLAADLSRAFRAASIEEAVPLPERLRVFLNLHPAEMADDRLLDSLREIPPPFRAGRALVLEVHEDAVADTASLRRLREALRELGIGLAYDDFGSGQARLAELAEVPPDFIKLDVGLVRDLDLCRPRQDIVEAIVRVSNDLGCQIIAEGVETEAEAEVCQRLGCQFGQGFLFARPQPAANLARTVAPGRTPTVLTGLE